ncbi:MAG: hypothetical protein ACMG6S_01725, partial [Byssovorax sp.]
GESGGRYRFVGNTFVRAADAVATGSAAFRCFDSLESVEMHDNVFWRDGGGGVQIIRDSDASWTTGHAVIAGSHNWVPAGSTEVPSSWTSTLTGANPGFANAAARDFRLTAGSPLRGQGIINPASAPGFAFPSPLAAALFQPPLHRLEKLGAALPRAVAGAVDIGAFAYGMAGTSAITAASGGDGAGASDEEESVDADAPALEGSASDGSPGSDASSESGGCSVGAASSPLPLGALAIMTAAGLFRWSRRRGDRG